VILGAGTVGRAAARQAVASGAHVILLDSDQHKLTLAHRELQGRVVTVVAAAERLEQYTPIADVLIGAVMIPGERAPFLVTESMVRAMKPGSVIVDVSIDQGGCVETSRPTTLDSPTFTVHDVVHYCVPNMSSNIARTASRVLNDAALPYILEIAGKGLETALEADAGLAAGVYTYKGRLVHEAVAHHFGAPHDSLAGLLEGRARQ
jgi:alanine dehydrogenase